MPGQEIQSVSTNPWKLRISLRVKADDIPSNISQNGHLIVKFQKKTANGTFVELQREKIKLNLSQCEQFVGLSIEENLPETISFVFILVREGFENRELQLQICDFRQTACVDFKEEKLKLTVNMASKNVKRTAIQTQLIHPCPLSITLYVNSNNMPFNDLTTGQLTITFEKKTSTDGFQELKSEIMTLNSATCNTEVRHIFVDGLESIFIVFALRRKGSHKEEKRLVMSDFYQTKPINLTDITFSIRLRSVTPTDIFSKPQNWLSDEEIKFRGWRRNHVMASIQKIYPENGITKDIHVPNIAVIGSGGGIRAVMGMCGAMTALQEADILDCTMHIAGLSGSAWYLTTLYAEHQPNLKKDSAIVERNEGFQRCLTRLRAEHQPNQEEETLTQSEGFKKSLGLVHAGIRKKLQKFRGLQGGLQGGLHGCLRKAWSLWKYYTTSRASNEGMFFTMTNVFGEVIGDVLLGEKSKNKRWSEQRLKLKTGSLPLPLIAALHVRNEKTIKEHHAWIEMSPFQAHIWRYGVSIGMAHFGNQYYAGFCKKTYAEPPLHFLQGVCGSAYAFVKNHKPEGNKWYMFVGKIKDWTWKIFNTFDHIFIAKMPTFLYGLQSVQACQPELASIDDDRIDSETQEMMLVDAGIAFNSPYPTVLRPGRQVDIILSFDFSDRGDDDAWPFEELEKAAVWAKQFHVPFPNIEARLKVIKENVNKENENNRKYEYEEVYVFRGCPNVVHFVMINKSYRKNGNDQDQDHDFNIHRNYPTLRFCYSEEEFDRFSRLIQHNVTKNKELIINEIRRAINRKIKTCQILEDNKRRKIEERRAEQEEKDRIEQEEKDRIEPEEQNRIE